jgi:hypothetical protein
VVADQQRLPLVAQRHDHRVVVVVAELLGLRLGRLPVHVEPRRAVLDRVAPGDHDGLLVALGHDQFVLAVRRYDAVGQLALRAAETGEGAVAAAATGGGGDVSGGGPVHGQRGDAGDSGARDTRLEHVAPGERGLQDGLDVLVAGGVRLGVVALVGALQLAGAERPGPVAGADLTDQREELGAHFGLSGARRKGSAVAARLGIRSGSGVKVR